MIRRRHIDPKYAITVTVESCIEIVNQTDVAIPEDEPLMLFRARDRNALPMLRYYQDLCELDGCTEFHMNGIANRIEAFENFALDRPERMKQPGITRGK